MKHRAAIRLKVSPQKVSRSPAPKVPAAYGRLLVELAARYGMDRDQFAEAAGFAPITAWRLAKGEGSVKAAKDARALLISRGATVPPVPVDDDDWTPPADDARAPRPGDSTEETIRKNLIRFREEAGYDQLGAADASGVPFETLRGYEGGELEIPNGALKLLASAYGRRPGDFFELSPAPPDLDAIPLINYRVRPGLQISDEDRTRLRELEHELNAKYRQARDAATKPPGTTRRSHKAKGNVIKSRA